MIDSALSSGTSMFTHYDKKQKRIDYISRKSPPAETKLDTIIYSVPDNMLLHLSTDAATSMQRGISFKKMINGVLLQMLDLLKDTINPLFDHSSAPTEYNSNRNHMRDLLHSVAINTKKIHNTREDWLTSQLESHLLKSLFEW